MYNRGATGVPKGVKMAAELVTEINRLHDLNEQGKFDWRSTPTSLRWLNAIRASPAAAQLGEVTALPALYEDSYDMVEELALVESIGA